MKLKRLLRGIPVKEFKGSKEAEITGVCANSKLVAPGNLFIAKKGRTTDGVRYIPEAVAAGAAAVLTDIYDPSMKNIAQLVHPDVAALESILAARYYQFPSEQLFMVGITGTNGKTTASFLIKHLLDSLRGPCGLIGTIEYIIGKHRYQATRTTPDVSSNHKMLREMVLQGCLSAVMEVTSHALDQGRVDGIQYDVGVFTNLTLDHLDYHMSMENYCAAKNKLFRALGTANCVKKQFPLAAVANADSPWLQRIVAGCSEKVLTYGIESEADVQAQDIELNCSGAEFTIACQGKKSRCRIPLAGRFNVYNALAAAGVALTQGFPMAEIIDILSCSPAVPGRLEPVPNDLGVKVYVDFAHTDDALLNVMGCLKEFKTGKLIVVFGCGGERDRGKRPKMARASEENADFTIVTSDNPRGEDPLKIAEEAAAGFSRKSSYLVEIDRKEAIEKALRIAAPGDIVLIAGKGHEAYQIFAHKTIEFDDRKTACEICRRICTERQEPM